MGEDEFAKLGRGVTEHIREAARLDADWEKHREDGFNVHDAVVRHLRAALALLGER